jgi:hypothetical protein
MGDFTVIQEVAKTLGPAGVLAAVLWYLLTKRLPEMHAQYRADIAKDREVLERVLFSLNQNLMAMRYLIATVTKAEYRNTDMNTLLCPHDGRPCTDLQRVKEYKEELHGADTGRVPAPAENLGSPGK